MEQEEVKGLESVQEFLQQVAKFVDTEDIVANSKSPIQTLITLSERPNLPSELIPQFLEVIENLEDRYYRSRALVVLTQKQNISPDYFSEILRIAETIYSAFYLDIFTALDPHLNHELRLQVLL
ncbi:MAG: hypothetical protein AAFY16_10280 [Cyanobacteria bacterium J06642_3]